MIKSVTFQIVTKVDIGNKTLKCRGGTEVCIWGKIILWVYYTLTEKTSTFLNILLCNRFSVFRPRKFWYGQCVSADEIWCKKWPIYTCLCIFKMAAAAVLNFTESWNLESLHMSNVSSPAKFDTNIFIGDWEMDEKQNPRWLLSPSSISNKGYFGPPITRVWSILTCGPKLVRIDQELVDTTHLFH